MPNNRITPVLERCLRIEMEPPYDGPYDVEGTGYSLTDDGGVAVYLQLGRLYDFYRLELACTLPASWDLWHLDSAVYHVDPECLQEGVVFASTVLLSVDAKELRIVIHTPAGERAFSGAVILVETASSGSWFVVTFRLTADTRLVFDRDGWTLHDGAGVIRQDALRIAFSALS